MKFTYENVSKRKTIWIKMSMLLPSPFSENYKLNR